MGDRVLPMDDDLGDFSAAWSQFCETDRELDVGGDALTVTQDWQVGHGGTVFDAALTTVGHLVSKGKPYWRGKRVVELGSGTGVVGLAASVLGAKEVGLTDVAANSQLLAYNAQEHLDAGRHVTVDTLVWGSAIPERYLANPADVVIACDVIYAVGKDGQSHENSMTEAAEVHSALAAS